MLEFLTMGGGLPPIDNTSGRVISEDTGGLAGYVLGAIFAFPELLLAPVWERFIPIEYWDIPSIFARVGAEVAVVETSLVSTTHALNKHKKDDKAVVAKKAQVVTFLQHSRGLR